MRTFNVVTALSFAVAIALGCGGGDLGSIFGGSGGDGNGGGGGGNGTPSFTGGDDGGGSSSGGNAPCVNLCKQQVACPNGGTTSVSGTVYAPRPSNPDPLYNAIVYVPNAPLTPFPKGVSCDKCGALTSGSPLVTTLSGPDGKFSLQNVPVGDDIPLVVQIGRWRREVKIPHVGACTDTPLPPDLTRLPRNQSEGDIPLFALSTGSADALECVLRKIGVDDAEFTLPGGTGRIQLFYQNGATMPGIPPASQLWSSAASMETYDITVLDCEGHQNDKPAAAQQSLIDYTNAGGRVFASHYSYVWLYDDAPFSGTAQWNVDQPHQGNTLTGVIDTSFPKGQAFATWLGVVNALSGPDQITIQQPRHDAEAAITPAQRWIYSPNPQSLQHYTFNTPVGATEDKQCGRVVFSDFHVTGANGQSADIPFPQECDNGPLTPQERVLEFMLFDLASCIQKDSAPPAPPTPIQ
jgi:hypothetical protein